LEALNDEKSIMEKRSPDAKPKTGQVKRAREWRYAERDIGIDLGREPEPLKKGKGPHKG